MSMPIGMAINAENTTAMTVYCRCSPMRAARPAGPPQLAAVKMNDSASCRKFIGAPAVTALTRRVRPPRVHGVSALPANMISVSMTTASTKIAMMPATIWSLLLDWYPSVNQVPRPPMPITEPTDTIEMLVTATTRRLAMSTGTASGSSTFSIRVSGL